MTIVLGIVRHALTTLGGGLVMNGYLTDGDLQAAVGALMTLLGIGASVWAKRQSA